MHTYIRTYIRTYRPDIPYDLYDHLTYIYLSIYIYTHVQTIYDLMVRPFAPVCTWHGRRQGRIRSGAEVIKAVGAASRSMLAGALGTQNALDPCFVCFFGYSLKGVFHPGHSNSFWGYSFSFWLLLKATVFFFFFLSGYSRHSCVPMTRPTAFSREGCLKATPIGRR